MPVSAFRVTMFESAVPVSAFCVTGLEPLCLSAHLASQCLKGLCLSAHFASLVWNRFHDFIAELDQCCFDIFLFSETWRVETEGIFVTPVGHKMFFSGGDGENGHQGVGVAIHKRLLHQIDSISFSAISSRVCQLQLSWGTTCFRCIAVYFPTSWHSEDEVEHVYTLLDLLLDACVKDGCIPILGGDFNACIGPLENHEAMDQIGHWGSGIQNERGRILMRFVLAKGLQICNRQSTTENMEASWTCCRTLDGTCVQLDYILANFRLQTVEVWNDFTLPIGLDHRCAHCISHFQWCSRPRRLQQRTQMVATKSGFQRFAGKISQYSSHE